MNEVYDTYTNKEGKEVYGKIAEYTDEFWKKNQISGYHKLQEVRYVRKL